MLARRAVAWALVADALPIYPLYALLFLGHGLSADQISLLFALWSLAGLVSGVPTGLLADRYSRRGCVAAAGPVKAAAFLCWLAFPSFAGFAAGFALWGLAGSLSSGALEALVYDGLTSYGAEASYPKVLGRLSAVELLGQLVATAGAAALFPFAGFAGVIWASAGLCLWSSVLAARIPEPRSSAAESDDSPGLRTALAFVGRDRRLRRLLIGASAGLCLWSSVLAARIPEPARGSAAADSDDSPGLRTALAFVGRDKRLRRLLIGVALLAGLDTLEEYFPLLAHSWGVPTQWNPLAIVVIPVVGAAGAVASGRMGQLPSGRIGALLGGAGLLLVAAFYGLYRLVLVQAGSLLQQHIEPSSRATVTSVAEVGVELCVYLMYAVWVLGGLLLAAAIVVVAASLLPRMLAPPQQPVGYGERVDEEDP